MLLSVRPVVLEVKWLYFISSIAFIYVNAFSYAKTFIVGDNRKKDDPGREHLWRKLMIMFYKFFFRELQPLFRRIRKVLVLPPNDRQMPADGRINNFNRFYVWI